MPLSPRIDRFSPRGAALQLAILLEAVESAAVTLHQKGVGKRDRVAIVAANSDVHVILLFALARLGAAMVPLNPHFGVAELAYILNHAAVSGVICNGSNSGDRDECFAAR